MGKQVFLKTDDQAIFEVVSPSSVTTYTIKADKYGLLLSVAIIKPNGESVDTQLGIACESKTAAHIDAL